MANGVSPSPGRVDNAQPKASPDAKTTGAMKKEGVGNRKEGSEEAPAADPHLPTPGYQPEPSMGADGTPGSNLIVDNACDSSGPEVALNWVAFAVSEFLTGEESSLQILVDDLETREVEGGIPTETEATPGGTGDYARGIRAHSPHPMGPVTAPETKEKATP